MVMGKKKKCELCSGVARMYCESDEASLCWDCDGKVHGANFLVAKHTRCLLCSACQSQTSWKASGLRLGPTVSLCDSCCLARLNKNCHRSSREEDHAAESYDEEEDEDEDEEDEDEEAENQVVPAALAQEAPVMSSSSSSVCSGDLVVKRTRRDLHLNCSSDEENESSSSSRPLKRVSRDDDEEAASSKSTVVVMKSVFRLEGGRRKSNG